MDTVSNRALANNQTGYSPEINSHALNDVRIEPSNLSFIHRHPFSPEAEGDPYRTMNGDSIHSNMLSRSLSSHDSLPYRTGSEETPSASLTDSIMEPVTEDRKLDNNIRLTEHDAQSTESVESPPGEGNMTQGEAVCGCRCGDVEDVDSDLVQCYKCQRWSHMACQRLGYAGGPKQLFVCHLCHPMTRSTNSGSQYVYHWKSAQFIEG